MQRQEQGGKSSDVPLCCCAAMLKVSQHLNKSTEVMKMVMTAMKLPELQASNEGVFAILLLACQGCCCMMRVAGCRSGIEKGPR